VNWIVQVIKSTIGRKLIAGLTGLGLVGFIVGHMLGNLNLFVGQTAMHEYAEALHHISVLEHYRLLWLIEIGLAGMFIAHIATVVSLILDNRKARGNGKYAVNASKRDERMSAIASKTMAFSGIFLLVFLIIHLIQFRLQREAIEGTCGSIGGVIVDTLQNPLWAAMYALGSVLVAWHIFHGIGSAARSLGINHRKYTPAITGLGAVVALIVGLGFTAMPLTIAAGVVDKEGFRMGGRDEAACIPFDEDEEHEDEEHEDEESAADH
jgi:succinate dehydrogenase / fumarate reductase cytochrome b subunit